MDCHPNPTQRAQVDAHNGQRVRSSETSDCMRWQTRLNRAASAFFSYNSDECRQLRQSTSIIDSIVAEVEFGEVCELSEQRQRVVQRRLGHGLVGE